MKNRTTAIVLAWIFWPALEFYLGQPGKGIAKVLTIGGLGVWAIIDAIKITTMSPDDSDSRYNAKED